MQGDAFFVTFATAIDAAVAAADAEQALAAQDWPDGVRSGSGWGSTRASRAGRPRYVGLDVHDGAASGGRARRARC